MSDDKSGEVRRESIRPADGAGKAGRAWSHFDAQRRESFAQLYGNQGAGVSEELTISRAHVDKIETTRMPQSSVDRRHQSGEAFSEERRGVGAGAKVLFWGVASVEPIGAVER